jgi:hypothetical protein
MKYLFAGVLGVMFSIIVMILIDQPYALYISAIGSFVVGWFSDDVYNALLKNRA